MAAQRFHIIIDLSQVPEEPLKDEAGLKNFLTELPGVIGMHVLEGPVIAEGIPENPGLSGFVIIDFSHISIHTFTEHKQALIDIFSCKSFNTEVAKKAVLDYFQVSETSAKIETISWG